MPPSPVACERPYRLWVCQVTHRHIRRSGGGAVVSIDSAISQASVWAASAVIAYLGFGLLATLFVRCAGAPGRLAALVLLVYPRAARAGLRTVVAAAVGFGATVGSAASAEAAAPPPPAPPL